MIMKVVVAPNAFKGSLTAHQAAQAIKRGILRVCVSAKVVCLPVSDGGDGLAEVLSDTLSGQILDAEVADPLFRPISGSFCYVESQKTAIVEMARASGLVLVPDHLRNPEKTTTFGTGQLIRKCLDLQAERLIIGLGGSATCDGGIGTAAALGYRFLDKTGQELKPVGGNLIHIHSIDMEQRDQRLDDVEVEAVCDVLNPLTGKNGASFVYSPQKGANPTQVKRLDEGLVHLAEVIRKELGMDLTALPGAGAAGGLGAGIHAFLGGKLKKGIDLVLDLVGLDDALAEADLVITGEGSMDYQTKYDKAPAGVARAAKSAGIPCIGICGLRGEGIDELHEIGLTSVSAICKGPNDVEKAMEEAEERLADTTAQVIARIVSEGIS